MIQKGTRKVKKGLKIVAFFMTFVFGFVGGFFSTASKNSPKISSFSDLQIPTAHADTPSDGGDDGGDGDGFGDTGSDTGGDDSASK